MTAAAQLKSLEQGAVERLADREDRTRNAEKSRLGMAPGMAHESAGDDGVLF